jgi:predicted membrane chloride channel (bestrophin family)
MGSSLVARRIAGPALVITLVSALVAVLRARYPVVAALQALAPVVQVAGGAICLLLAFRTNAAFARFNHAADAFAEVLSATRNLSRKMVVWCPLDDREANARLVAAIPWAI